MADKWPLANGNWSSAANWNGGTLPLSTDDVYADGKTVVIDQTITVATLRSTQRTGGTVNGWFEVLNGGITVNATTIIGSSATNSSDHATVETHNASGTVTINAAMQSGTNNTNLTNFAVWVRGSATVVINGSANVGSSTNGALQIDGGTTTLTGSHVGLSIGSGTNGVPIYAKTGTLNLYGSHTNRLLRVVSPATALNINFNYNVTCASTGSNNQVIYKQAGSTTCNITVNGNIVGGTVSGGFLSTVTSSGPGVNLTVNGSVTLNSTSVLVFGGNASSSQTNCVINGDIIFVATPSSSTTGITGGYDFNMTVNGDVRATNVATSGGVIGLSFLYNTSNVIINGEVNQGLAYGVNFIAYSPYTTVIPYTPYMFARKLVSTSSMPNQTITNWVVSGSQGGTFRARSFDCGPYGIIPVTGRFIIEGSPATQDQVRLLTPSGALKTLVDPLTITPVDIPAVSDVRLGTTYNFNNNTGTLAVPPANRVSAGIAVDNTVGTAYIAVDDIRPALGMASANLDTQLTTIVNRLPTSLVGGRMDSVAADTGTVATNVQAIKAKTDQLAFTVANQVDANSLTGGLTQAQIRTAVGLASANLDAQLGAIDDYLDTEIAAIKAKTDLITSGNISVLQDRVSGDTITMQYLENTSVTVPLNEDTTALTLQFVVSRPDGTDVLSIANGSIARTSTDFTVTINTAVTATLGQYSWCLRDITTGDRAVGKGVLTVQAAAAVDA